MSKYTATKINRLFMEHSLMPIYNEKGDRIGFYKVHRNPPMPAQPDPKENMVLLRHEYDGRPVYKMMPSRIVKWEPETKKSRAGIVYNYYKPVVYDIKYAPKQ